MAGVRQHTLPKFLLKGFASKTSGQEVFTWLYRKGTKIFETNIVNVAVEKHFYGKEDDLNVDDEITDLEGDFAIILNELRTKDVDVAIVDPNIAEFVAHLCTRTKHLRTSIIESTSSFTDMLFGYFEDYNNFKPYVLRYLKKHPEVIRGAIDEQVKKMPLNRSQRKRFRQHLRSLPAENIIAQLDKNAPEYEMLFRFLGEKFRENIGSLAKESHIKTLAKTLIPEPRVAAYRKLNWHIFRSMESLVLGDVGCLFEIAGSKKCKSLSEKEDEIKNIYLPISSNSLLIGTSSNTVPKVDIKTVNENFVKCSREFFVSNDSTHSDLLPLLNTEAQILGKEEIELLMKEIIDEG